MKTIPLNTYQSVLDVIRTWPSDQRLLLVQDVMKTLESTGTSTRPKCPTVDDALGLLATDQPAPSDSDVTQWLEERRMEKYG